MIKGYDRYRSEFRCKRIDGEYSWLAEDVRIEKVEANEWNVVGVTTDITDRKHTEEALTNSEEALRQAQKMEAIGRLAGGIAHDFNNLLTAISGFGELLLDSVQRSDPRREFVTQIMEASQRAATLTRQLLAFGRKQILQPKVVNMNEVIVGTERILERLIGEDVALLTDLDTKIGNVRVDPGQIEQVIMNLAVNARDAMPEGGTITIKTSRKKVTDELADRFKDAKAGPYVVLAVDDTGCGIDPDIGDKIFEPFFTTKEVGKGTGLGLSTVYGHCRSE